MFWPYDVLLASAPGVIGHGDAAGWKFIRFDLVGGVKRQSAAHRVTVASHTTSGIMQRSISGLALTMIGLVLLEGGGEVRQRLWHYNT